MMEEMNSIRRNVRKKSLAAKLKALIASLFFMATYTAHTQVVISEILPTGTVELKNIGNQTVDVGSYWLCDFPAYERLQNLNVICGDLVMEPGSLLAIDNFDTIDEADGELGLNVNSGFGSANNIIDYVEWGSTGHGRSNVAVSAGIWTTGAYVPSFENGQSLSNSCSGDDSLGEWTAGESTICEVPLGALEEAQSIVNAAFKAAGL